MTGECPHCIRLLDEAKLATIRYLRATAKLSLARLRHEYEKLPALESEVDPLARERIEALKAYQHHRAAHVLTTADEAA